MFGLKKLRPHTIRSVAIVVVAVFLCVFTPTLYVVAWRVGHGPSLQLSGKRVDVPWGWTGSGDTTEVVLDKSPHTLLFGTWPVSGFTISKYMGAPSADDSKTFENWKQLHIMLPSSDAVTVATTGDDSHLACTQVRIVSSPKRVNVSCLAYPSMMHGEFVGKPSDVTDFIRILRKFQ